MQEGRDEHMNTYMTGKVRHQRADLPPNAGIFIYEHPLLKHIRTWFLSLLKCSTDIRSRKYI